MNFLHPTVKHPKSVVDYKKTSYEIQDKDLHPIYQIKFHKKTSEILYYTMKNKAMSVQKLQNTF